MRVKIYGIGSTGNHFKNDSVYKDPYTNNLKLEDRKTKVPNWVRFYVS